MFEDHPTLVRSGPIVREQTLNTIKGLGADTLRIEVKWAEVAPSPTARKQPGLRRDRSGRLSGLPALRRPRHPSRRKGFRVMITLAPDAPRWATARRPRRQLQGQRLQVRRLRARGRPALLRHLRRPAARSRYWSIWNEPNHIFFLKPRAQSRARLPRHGADAASRRCAPPRRGARRSSSASLRRSAPRPRSSARCGSCSSGSASTAGSAAARAGRRGRAASTSRR